MKPYQIYFRDPQIHSLTPPSRSVFLFCVLGSELVRPSSFISPTARYKSTSSRITRRSSWSRRCLLCRTSTRLATSVFSGSAALRKRKSSPSQRRALPRSCCRGCATPRPWSRGCSLPGPLPPESRPIYHENLFSRGIDLFFKVASSQEEKCHLLLIDAVE